MKLELLKKEDLATFKSDMQQAFRLGAIEGGFPTDGGEILPEEDIEKSLADRGSIAYKAVINGELVGGAIIVVNEKKNSGHLDFLYVKHGLQSKGIGKFIWFEIEKLHPEIILWGTCTPYFEKRNIHFYINVCGFSAVKFYNERLKDPNSPPDSLEEDGMFEFRKKLNK